MLRETYLHPNGQMPAYEWNFGDVNPPVHAWATLFLYHDRAGAHAASGDVAFLKRAFSKLLLNFTWWVNRKDRERQATCSRAASSASTTSASSTAARRCRPAATSSRPTARRGWRSSARTCSSIALELAADDPTYEDMALQVRRALPLDRRGAWTASATHDEMWDEEDGFFYDVLRLPDGSATRLKVRSMVGLLPLCATTVVEPMAARARCPSVARARAARPASARRSCSRTSHDPTHAGRTRTGACCRSLDEDKLRRVLARMLDENEFLEPLRHPVAVARRTASTRTCSTSHGAGVPGRLPARRVRHRHVRRQLELARADLVPDERPAHPRAAAVLRVLRRRLHRWSARRLGHA